MERSRPTASFRKFLVQPYHKPFNGGMKHLHGQDETSARSEALYRKTVHDVYAPGAGRARRFPAEVLL
jgi:hypothetical protein